jgi:hypothetical protein
MDAIPPALSIRLYGEQLSAFSSEDLVLSHPLLSIVEERTAGGSHGSVELEEGALRPRVEGPSTRLLAQSVQVAQTPSRTP